MVWIAGSMASMYLNSPLSLFPLNAARRPMCRADREAFEEIRREAQSRYSPKAIISAEEMLFYIKAEDVEETFAFLKSFADPAHVAVYRDSRKVYCIPQSLNKGAALRRYTSRYVSRYANHFPPVFAAGDSAFDISMLTAADVSFCPPGLLPAPEPGKRRIICEGLFSDDICRELLCL